MTRRLDEEKTAMDASILDVSLSLSSKFFPQISRMLVFDILDDWIPATICQSTAQTLRRELVPSVIVDLISIARGINNIESQTDTILFDDCIFN